MKRLLTVERGGGRVASLVVHGRDEAPLVRLGRVSLRRVLTYVAVVPSHCVDTSIEYGHAHVAPMSYHHTASRMSRCETEIRKFFGPALGTLLLLLLLLLLSYFRKFPKALSIRNRS